MHVRFPAALALCLLASVAQAQEAPREKPLWELGVAAGGAWLPDYPAAGQNHFNAIGLPYIVYRGDFFRSDEKGLLRGRFVKSRDFELDVSLSGSFSADSDNNDARRGMPDLDYLVEFGPRIQWTLARAAKWAKLDFELPVRAVFSTDLKSIDYQGFLAQPELAYQHANFLDSGLALKLGVSASFADAELQDYFYGVDPQFATPARPAYEADAGYLGSRLQLVLTKALGPALRIFAAGRVDFHQGAANQDSPLFREDVTYGAGVGVVWSIFRSPSTVKE
jgi:outer membrane scaffolding protein for murein synthesis (MipA/OmpV family)